MCGIAGLINLNGAPVAREAIKLMTDAIAHRGPDGEGQWVEGNVGIGHRRLAIIDLSESGHQPMLSQNGRYILSYNGEIYNYKELRKELQELGHHFQSYSDSEVVMHAIMEWQEKAFIRFNGMFAIAFWDCKERNLLLARDRYGIKPLYTAQQRGHFWFASEQKAILADDRFIRVLDKGALLEYFTFQNIFSDKTLFDDIKLAPAGHYLKIDLRRDAPKVTYTKYWDYHFREPDQIAKKEEYVEELYRLFQQAVNRQLISDVEIGSYLSGGIDSGSITSVAAAKFSQLKTFTCGFDLSSASGLEMGFDERAKAEAMSASFKTEHYEIVLKAGDMERCLPMLAWHLEEPRVGQSYPNYYAAKLASKFVKVVMSGSGGDELFGGYPWRYYRAVNNLNFEHYIEKYYGFWQRMVPSHEMTNLFSPIWSDVKEISTRDIFRNVFQSHNNILSRPEDYINHSLYFEAKTFLQGLFIVEDKLSMAHGLETRVPFMDNDLVDFAMQCPVGLKLNNLTDVIRINENEPGNKANHYLQKTNDGKQILRDAMSRRIPANVIKAAKQGFSSPDASWFRGESMNFIRRRLMCKNARIYEWLDRKIVLEFLEKHLSGAENNRLLIWSLLSIEEWAEKFEK